MDLEDLENLLKSSDKKTLVTLMHANNEIGTVLDIKKVGELCQQYKALFHSDTVQTFAHYPINVQEINVDFISHRHINFTDPKELVFCICVSKVKYNRIYTVADMSVACVPEQRMCMV
ncbi:MAG: aminotransferase class V-fold PLP-dependent enzyme [Chitinophagales bacterium]